jgi:ERF superfamily
MEDDKELTAPTNPAAMLAAAIQKNIDPAGIETLARVYFQFEEQRAIQAYNAAMAAFQHECPIVLKKTRIDFPTKKGGRFTSQYAEMDDIIEATRELRHKHGFSYTFKHRFEKDITSVCEVSHLGGHTRATEFSVPLPKDFLITEQHAAGAAVTFCDRYAFRAAFGITTGMPDTDGKAFIGAIPAEQVEQLRALVKETDCEKDEAFWKYAGVDRLEDIPADAFARIWQALQIRKRRIDEAKRGGQP